MKYKESNILIIIEALKRIIAIFLGPFLTAYFIKTSMNSINDLSLYYIVNYGAHAIFGIIMGAIVKKKYRLAMFRLGIISNFIYILFIVLLQEKMLNYIPQIAFLYGFSAIAYYYPYNLFASTKIKNSDRTEYEFKKKTTQSVIGILIPVLLGSIISTTNFRLTAIIILIISIIQIILSLLLKPIGAQDDEFNVIDSFKKLTKNKDVKNMFIVDFFKGFFVTDSALDATIVILIISAFKTEMNLGIISSIASVFIIFMQYIYTKYLKDKDDRHLIISCSFIPIVVLLILILKTSNVTLTLYYFIYMTTINLLALILDVRLFNVANSKIVRDGNFLEYWSIREFFLNLGRVSGYILLFLVGLTNKLNLLYYLMILLAFAIIITGYFVSKVRKYNSVK